MLQCDVEETLRILTNYGFSICARKGVRSGSQMCKCNSRGQVLANLSKESHVKDFKESLLDVRPSRLEANLCFESWLCNPSMMRQCSKLLCLRYWLPFLLFCWLVQGLICLWHVSWSMVSTTTERCHRKRWRKALRAAGSKSQPEWPGAHFLCSCCVLSGLSTHIHIGMGQWSVSGKQSPD